MWMYVLMFDLVTWLLYTTSSYCAKTVLCQVSARNKRKESLTRVQTILWKKSPTVKSSVQINIQAGLQNSRTFCLSTVTEKIPSFTSLFLSLRLVLEGAECTHTWVHPHPAVLSAFSGLSTVNSGTSPTAFSILTWQRVETRFFWFLKVYIVLSWVTEHGCRPEFAVAVRRLLSDSKDEDFVRVT